MAERALIRHPVCFEAADARPIFIVLYISRRDGFACRTRTNQEMKCRRMQAANQ